MTTNSPEAKKITEKATIEESCRPELNAMGQEEIDLLSSLREPVSQAVKQLKKDEALVQEVLDQYEEGKGSKRRGTELLAKAIHDIQKIYNSQEALEGFRDAVREVDRTLRRTAELRNRRMNALQEWEKLLSGVEAYQGKLGSKLPEAQQGARKGEVAATFELKRIQQELVDISDIILNSIQPEVEVQRREKESTLSKEDLRGVEMRLQGLLAKIQSLLAPQPSQRGTGPLSKKNQRWAEGAYQA